MEKKKLFSLQTNLINRTIFFDIKEADNQKPYLVITESKKEENNQYQRKSLVLFENDLGNFAQSFVKILMHFNGSTREAMIEEARKKHPKAFEKWTEKEETELKNLYEQGTPLDNLSHQFGRKVTAIKARLVKLGAITEQN